MAGIVANFPNSANALPMWVAAERGLFAKRGLEIAFVEAQGSASQYRALAAGEIQVFTTLMENVIAYALGEGEVAFDPPVDAFVFMGASRGQQSLMARPEIPDVAALRGRTLAASGLRTGNALLLYGLLARHGLVRDRDYRVVAIGRGPVTVAAMDAAEADAALMGAPNDAWARAQGWRRLGDTTEAFGGYQSSVYTASRAWAEGNRETLVALIAALVEAHRAIAADPQAATAILRTRLKSLSDDDAGRMVDDLVGPAGLNPDGRIAAGQVAVLLELRAALAGKSGPAASPERFYDLAYLEVALAQL